MTLLTRFSLQLFKCCACALAINECAVKLSTLCSKSVRKSQSGSVCVTSSVLSVDVHCLNETRSSSISLLSG